MTIPTLMQNHQRKVYVTQLRKFYSETSQALLQYQSDRNAVNLKEAGINSLDGALNFINSTFKILNNCGADREPCFAPEYKKLDGTVMTETFCASYSPCMVLANGMSVAIYYQGNSNALFQIIFDINGQKGPNIVGRDFFTFYIYNNGVIDDIVVSKDYDYDSDSSVEWDESVQAPLSTEQRENGFENNCKSSAAKAFGGCFGKILNDNWDMTY